MSKTVNAIVTNETLQAALTIIIWTTICILYIMERPVADPLLTAGGIILGFYFHNSAQKAVERNEARLLENKRSR